ncbi:hypothetical protein CK203_097105 [Vitis vinifera]|uniref:Uncharacterized protein n=1 Tax=Vitis vinifera TaxID=29760 RepID=A0A438BPM9_VITVI|nr:hypothetical protein CK203_097105 [Vitis vinifera]
MCHEALQYLKKGGPGKSPSTGDKHQCNPALHSNLVSNPCFCSQDYDIIVNGIAKEHEPLFKLGEKWDIAMAAVYLASKSLSM